MDKLAQLTKLMWESYAEPMAGEAGKPVIAGPGEMGVMFLGHSSFFVQVAGLNLLIDPVFSTRLVVLRRQRKPGVRVADLPPIDAVLVTHAHMDHLSRQTLRAIARATKRVRGVGPAIVVPQGVEDLVGKLGFREIRTLEWWGATELAGPQAAVQVTLTPCRHWGARMFHDTHRGFGGYFLRAGEQSLYHTGDTAYFDGFAEIGERLGHARVALMPIGAYFPDSYRSVHTNPEEAVQGFCDTGAEIMIPMHFGTFRLGREPMDEPVKRLQAEAVRRGIEARVRVLAEGATMIVPSAPNPPSS